MTLEELQNLHYLPKEIAHYDAILADFDKKYSAASIPLQQRLEYKAAIDDYRKAIVDNRNRCIRDLERLQSFVDNIKDPFIQAIYIERFGKNRAWWDVAAALAERFGRYTAPNLQNYAARYLAKHNKTVAADPATPTHSIDNHA